MGNSKDSLGDRMKENYENRSKTYLIRRMPVIIRLDGKAFHSFTRGFDKPFDNIMMQAMQQTTLKLCQNIQGCVFGYTQSDEISLVLVDYNSIETDAWFDYNVQKVCSVAASMCTLYFNQIFEEIYSMWFASTFGSVEVKKFDKLINEAYEKAIAKGALFDARVFNIPREEVLNCILWRIKDANRNSVNSLAQGCFSHKELQGKNVSQVQDMLMDKFGINWNDLSNFEKGGTLISKGKNGFCINDVCIKNYNDIEKFFAENEIQI